MKMRLMAAVLVILAAGGMVFAAARRQEKYELPKPTKFHEFFKQFEGTWDAAVEFAGDKPGDPPKKSKGGEVNKLAIGNLFLFSDFKGEMEGAPFVGHSLTGYDTHKKKYTGCWVDSMSTAVWTLEGTLDEAGKVLTLMMEGPNPMSGAPMKMKLVHEITGKDAKKLTMFMDGEDGKEMQFGKIEYTRKK